MSVVRSRLFVFLVVEVICLSLFNVPLPTQAQVAQTNLVELTGSVSRDLGQPAGTPDGSQAAQVVLVLAPRNQAALEKLSYDIQDPASPRYRQVLSDAEYAQNYAPDPQNVTAIIKYYTGLGLSLNYQSSSSLVLTLDGPLSKLDQAFGTSSQLRSTVKGEVGRINVTPYKIPSFLSSSIVGVLGFDQLHAPEIHSAKIAANSAPQTNATSSVFYSSPASLRKGYSFPINQTGAGTKVGIVLWSAPNLSDVNRWAAANNLKANVAVIPAGTAATTDDFVRFEANMDVQMVLTAAPDTAVRFFVSKTNSYDALAAALQQAIDDKVNVISASWGGCERDITTATINSYHTIIQNAAVKGIPVIFSSGDSGAYECNSGGATSNSGYTGFPSSDPLVTSVGATALERNNSTNAWVNETAWSCPTADGSNEATCLQSKGGASEGGATLNYARPDYQSAVNPAAEAKFTNKTASTRLQPDISLNGDPRSGEIIYFTSSACNDNCLGGGTSAAAPFLAGIVALAAQQKSGQVAGLNTFLYKKFSTTWGYDVVGGYTGVSAKTGWDFTTGLGSIKNVSQFLNAYVGLDNFASKGYTITTLFPDAVPVKSQGGKAFTLTVNGAGFTAASKIFWNGTVRTTTLVNAKQLIATIPDTDLGSSGTASVTVANGADDGSQSNALSVTVSGSCLNRVVTRLDDVNVCGSLRYALQTASSGTVINIALTAGQQITLGSTALAIPAGVNINGVCSPTGAGITINGSATNKSLTLNGSNTLYGLALTGFGGGQTQIKAATPQAGKVSLQCTAIRAA